MNPDTEALMTPLQVSRYLGVSRSKVYLMCARGELPGVVRLGVLVRVHRVSLEKWIEARATPVQPA